MRLRTLLALMFTLLLAFTAASIGWRGYSSSRIEIKRFTQQEFAQTNAYATHHVIDFLDDPASRLLTELTLLARRGMLKLGDDHALGFDLAERLRVNPTLAWISYSDAATGHFTGVWRNAAGDVVLNINSPGPGHVPEVIVRPDGTTAPYVRHEPDNYDPRIYPWYQNAAASNTTAWSPPYMFLEGTRGITASRAWRVTDSSPVAGGVHGRLFSQGPGGAAGHDGAKSPWALLRRAGAGWDGDFQLERSQCDGPGRGAGRLGEEESAIQGQRPE